MYTSSKKSVIIWIGISVFCLVFFIVYNQFSHGVHSPYMTWLFAWPLVFGVIPSIVIICVKRAAGKCIWINKTSYNLYCSGVASLTVSSLMRGIFDIAGTGSKYQVWLMYAGVLFVIAGIIDYRIDLLRRAK